MLVARGVTTHCFPPFFSEAGRSSAWRQHLRWHLLGTRATDKKLSFFKRFFRWKSRIFQQLWRLVKPPLYNLLLARQQVKKTHTVDTSLLFDWFVQGCFRYFLHIIIYTHRLIYFGRTRVDPSARHLRKPWVFDVSNVYVPYATDLWCHWARENLMI